MLAGNQPPETRFGSGENLRELGALLKKRVSILEEWYLDDDLWEDR